jgi:enamine deaminase RidA (YjgF/YER057c/UK114 family)
MIFICTLVLSSSILANTNPDFRYLEPDGVALPQASFGLGIVIEPGHRLAFLTGRTGSNPDGSYPDDFETQARNALDSTDIPVWGRVRDEVVGDSRPSGTGVIVKALAAPGARVEVTVIAAQKVE